MRLPGQEAPTAGRQSDGRATLPRSSPDSDLEALSHNPTRRRSFTPSLFNQADDQLCESTVPLASRKSRHRAIKKQRRYERYGATSRLSPRDVPPSPNSPPDNVFRSDRTELPLVQKRGKLPAPIH
ncbi:hypothetical protein OIU85_001109 [Salix viminalis]|uniref:Uncharacterized protein n=1 Tax=Salix viminalis TaxID=40686 RepID=A0A9Q0ZXP7_SALVM|nr:hypothetical protein OIU85_001109 [Salix viminalis]